MLSFLFEIREINNQRTLPVLQYVFINLLFFSIFKMFILETNVHVNGYFCQLNYLLPFKITTNIVICVFFQDYDILSCVNKACLTDVVLGKSISNPIWGKLCPALSLL